MGTPTSVDRAEIDRPAMDRPGHDRPEHDRPGTDQSEHDRREHDRRDLDDAIGTLGAEADRRSAELAEGLRIPADLGTRVARAGLFRQLVPLDLGGLGLPPVDWFRNGVALARHDASLGWVVTQGAAVLGQLAAAGHPDLVDEVLARPDAALAVSIAGGANLSSDLRSVQGRWGFASGCDTATWLGGLAMVEGADPLEMRWVVVPAARARIERTWDPIGMRGTGSHTITIEAQEIPPNWSYGTRTPSPHRDDPHSWTVGNGNWPIGASVAATQLGAARRALDEVTALITTKSPAPDFAPLASSAAVRRELMTAEGTWTAASGLVEFALGELWRAAESGRPLGPAERAAVATAHATANRLAVEVTHQAAGLAGTDVVPSDAVLGRCVRDVTTLRGHISANAAILERAAAVHLGLAEPDMLV